MVHHLSKAEARRIAVQAQLLDLPRPDDALAVVRHLTFLQHDQTAAVAPSADLVLWSRLGSTYDAGTLRDALDRQDLIDHHGLLRPSEDLALYRAEMRAWPGPGQLKPWQRQLAAWVEANDGCRREILELLRREGPLPAGALPDTCEVPWRSSGWNDHKNVQRLLVQMVERGEVAISGREGRVRLWDLAERIYPDDPVPDVEEARRRRDEKRLGMLGLARARATTMPTEPHDVGEAGEPATVEGVKGTWRLDPSWLDRPFTGRAALLSPLDRMVADRKRLSELFDYEYYLEMYKPKAARRWGYFALPVLVDDRLVGKLDATAEPAEGVLRVDALHEDAPFDERIRALVDAEIDDLARWLDLEVLRPS